MELMAPFFPPSPISWLSVPFQDTWLYHLTVAAGGSSAKVGTAYEQLIAKLMDDEGGPGKARWPVLLRWEGGGWELLVKNPKKTLLYCEAVLKASKPQKPISVPRSRAPVSGENTEVTPLYPGSSSGKPAFQ